MPKPPNNLLELILALSPKEKRSVEQYLETRTRGGSNQLLALFSAYADAHSYPLEAKWQKRNPILSSQNLPTLKQRLEAIVLNEVGSSSASQNTYSEIQLKLAAVGGLFQKQLHKQAIQVLRKVQKKAARFDYKTIQLTVLDWERRMITQKRTLESRQRLQELHESQSHFWETVKREMSLKNLLDEVVILFYSQKISTQETQAKLNSILSSSTFYDPDEIQEKRCRLLIYEIRGFCNLGLEHFETAIRNFELALCEWEQDPAWIDEFPQEFLKDYTRYLNSVLLGAKEVESLRKHSEKLGKLPLSNPGVKFRLNYYGFQQQLMVYLNYNNWELAEEVAAEAEQWLAEGNKLLTRQHRLTFLYNFAVLKFMQDQYPLALPYLNEIMDMPGSSERPDIRCAARLLVLVSYLEKEDFDYVAYFLESTKAWFKRNHPEENISKALFKLSYQVLKQQVLNQPDIFSDFKAELERGTPVTGQRELTFWAESKIKKIPLKQVCEERISAIRRGEG